MSRLRYLLLVAVFLGLSACSLWDDTPQQASPGGLVVGDEPYAVRAGARVLTEGGSAADAATATYFALAVTYPVAAGLGGGGLCIVHDPSRGGNNEIDFLPRDTIQAGAYAVPGTVAGFALLQSRYGKLAWQRTVAPGEELASTGFSISHALAKRLDDNQNLIRLDAGLAAEFLDESGRLRPEGSTVSNPSLAQTLSEVRTTGQIGFYQGAVANRIATYSAAEGGAITTAELSAYAAGEGPAAATAVGVDTAFLPSRHVGAGAFIGAMLSHLVGEQGGPMTGENLATAVASATKQTMDEFHVASLPRDLGATAFAATDAKGQAVACAVTMNGPFGSGHTAAGTGITLARSPSSTGAGLAGAFLTPAIVLNGAQPVLVGAGAGGPNGTAALVYAILKLSQGADLTQPGEVHSTGIAPYDTVNVIACTVACAALPDPGASGLGAAAGTTP